METLKREYYPLPLAASIIGCTADDLIHLAATGKIRLGALFHADCFTDDEVSFAAGAPDENVMDVRGFAYLEQRCMEHFEQVGQCIFNAIEMLDGRNVTITGTRGRVTRLEDVYMHASDMRALRDEEGTAKPLSETERSTLLVVIAALCDYSAINYQERGAANQIAKMTEEIGAAVSDDTVRRMLAKIPAVLKSRMK